MGLRRGCTVCVLGVNGRHQVGTGLGSAACPHYGQARAMGMKSAGQCREWEEKHWTCKGYPSKWKGCCFGHKNCLHCDSTREPRKSLGLIAEE